MRAAVASAGHWGSYRTQFKQSAERLCESCNHYLCTTHVLFYYNCYSCYRTLPNIQHNTKATGHSLVAPSFHTRIHASFLGSNSDLVWGQSFSPFSSMDKQEAQSGGLTIRNQTLASTDSRSSAPESCTRFSLLPCVAVSPQTTAFPYELPNRAGHI